MTREELYELVWSTPCSIAAGRLGVSDVYLGRVCRSLDVPKPPPGYWRKRAVGQAPPPPALPDPRPGTPRVWTKGNAAAQPPAPRPGRPAGPARLPSGRSRRAPHELVRQAAEHFRAAEPGADGYLRPRKKLLPDISASRDGLSRCLRFASDLFYDLEARGHRPMIAPAFERLIRVEFQVEDALRPRDSVASWSPLRPTVAYVFGVPVGLSVVEMSETRKMRYVGEGRFVPARDYRPDRHPGPTWTVERPQPTGKMKLVAYSPFHGFDWSQEWTDTPGSPLGGRIDKIITVLEGSALTLTIELERTGRYF